MRGIKRRQARREFIARELRSPAEARRTGKNLEARVVIGRLERMLLHAKTGSRRAPRSGTRNADPTR